MRGKHRFVFAASDHQGNNRAVEVLRERDSGHAGLVRNCSFQRGLARSGIAGFRGSVAAHLDVTRLAIHHFFYILFGEFVRHCV